MPNTRSWPFRRIAVDHMVDGPSRVWWSLEETFKEPFPHSAQLQFGYTGLNQAVDWIDVGEPVLDGYYAQDDAKREWGQVIHTHYRIKLTTSKAVHVSQPASCAGELNEKDWCLAREILRKEYLRHKKVSRVGYLLKRIRFGALCTDCRDPLTSDITDSDCPECNGTGFKVGYHAPVPCQVFDFKTETVHEHVDATMRGTIREFEPWYARIVAFPMLEAMDVYVDRRRRRCRWFCCRACRW